jgi:hypothetical protein
MESYRIDQVVATPEKAMKKLATSASIMLLILLSNVSYGRAQDNQPPAKSDESVGQTAAGVGHAVKETAVDFGHAAKEAGVGVGHAVKDAAVEVGHFAKDNAIKAGHAVRDAAKEVGNAVKPGSREPAPVKDGTPSR